MRGYRRGANTPRRETQNHRGRPQDAGLDRGRLPGIRQTHAGRRYPGTCRDQAGKGAAGASTARIRQLEAARIRAALPAQATLIALDERGRQPSTVELSDHLARWMQEGRQPCFVIGGADGLDPSIREGSDLLLGLSRLTLPHGLVRVLLAEQLYRAVSILKGHPYHRE